MNILSKIVIKLIKGYQFFISPLLGNTCRFVPTCSDYAIEALKTFGFFKGLYFSFKRILSCHPWVNSGHDPVKKQMKVKK